MKNVSIIASGFSLLDGELKKTQDFWKEQGVSLKRPKGIKRKKDFLCASDLDSRLQDLKKAFSKEEDSEIVWALRGGYGMQELLPNLLKKDFSREKTFIGFSDCTSLHYYLNKNLKQSSIHGPHPNGFYKNLNSLKINNDYSKILKNPHLFSPVFRGLKRLNQTKKLSLKAPLIGGNLTTLVSLLGTKWDQGSKGSFLFLEETEEPAYKINRMLTHLDQSNFLKKVKAVIFGHMSYSSKSQEELIFKVIKRWAKNKDFPVIWGMEAGHRHEFNNPFWLGKTSLLLLDSKLSLHNNI